RASVPSAGRWWRSISHAALNLRATAVIFSQLERRIRQEKTVLQRRKFHRRIPLRRTEPVCALSFAAPHGREFAPSEALVLNAPNSLTRTESIGSEQGEYLAARPGM